MYHAYPILCAENSGQMSAMLLVILSQDEKLGTDMAKAIIALSGYRTASVGDGCVRKKGQSVTLCIYFCKNMFPHFRSHFGVPFSTGIHMHAHFSSR